VRTRPSIRHGLPYGWWRSPDVWASIFCLLLFIWTVWLIIALWFFGWELG
jgi:hypothetical protein